MTSRARPAAAAAAPRWRWRCACCRSPTAATTAAACATRPAGTMCFGFRTSFGRVPADGRDVWLPSMGVLGPMARNVPDLADAACGAGRLRCARAVVARASAGRSSRRRWTPRSQRQAHRLGRRLQRLCALRARRAGCLPSARSRPSKRSAASSRRPCRTIPSIRSGTAWRGCAPGRAAAALLAYYDDPAKRALLKPEAIFEIESGLKLSAFDITAASAGAHANGTRPCGAVRALRLFHRPDRAALSRSTSTCIGRSEIAGRRWRPITNG